MKHPRRINKGYFYYPRKKFSFCVLCDLRTDLRFGDCNGGWKRLKTTHV